MTGEEKFLLASRNTTDGTNGFFLRMLERGIAYKKKSRVNWCPKCCTVLANEQVVKGGFCWRHEDNARGSAGDLAVVFEDDGVFGAVVG